MDSELAIETVAGPSQAPEVCSLEDGCMFPYEEANPCVKCKAVTIDTLFKGRPFLPAVTHYSSLPDLQSSVSNGCCLCKLLYNKLLDNAENIRRDRLGSEELLQSIEEGEKNDSVGFIKSYIGPRTTSLETPVGSSRVTYTFLEYVLTFSSLNGRGDIHRRMNFPIYTDHGDIAENFVSTYRLPIRPNNSSSLFQIQKWVETFENELPSQNQSLSLPRRVIDVQKRGQSEDVYLVDFGEGQNIPKDHYICLSYRWGNKPTTRTTQSNFNSHVAGIPLKSLSQTHRDTVELTRYLGIRYLWIDCLCIIQGNSADWELESAKMGGYYRNSWLTVAAGLSGDASSGLFGERQDPGYIRLQSPYENRIATLYFTSDVIAPPARAERQRDIPFKSSARLESPLYTRAWTLQEEALSNRFLSLEDSQIYLRYGKTLRFESGPEVLFYEEQCIHVTETFLREPIAWQSFVEHYSTRELSFASDKLPAISGLAHEYSLVHLDDRYLAGLWSKSLMKDLLWSRDGNSAPSVRPGAYRAPSWSWAAVDAKIGFRVLEGIKDTYVEILSAQTLSLGKNHLGRVTAGEITLRGRLIPGKRWARPSEDFDLLVYPAVIDEEFQRSSKTNTSGDNEGLPILVMDAVDAHTTHSTIWFLPVLKVAMESYNQLHGLALVESEQEPGKYERVGSLLTYGSSPFASMVLPDIQVVRII